jgi:ABC-type uncharacterized transport system substrate-binding protein
MRRRDVLGLFGAAAAGALAHAAQTPARVARIGFLTPTRRVPPVDAFELGMRELGWVEGENLRIEFRYADNDEDRMPALAATLADLPLDAIVAVGPAVFAAHRASPAIPIVATAAPDLVAMGMVASLAHPGGLITGEILFLPEYVAKRLEFLKEIAPSLTRAGVLLFRGLPWNADTMRAASRAAEKLHVALQPIELAEVGEFEGAFPAATPLGGFVTTDHPLFAHNAAALAGVALKRGLPWVGAVEDAAGGALLGYGADFSATLRHAAVFVDKILRGAKAGDIPMEQASKFTTIANLKTAAALGVEIPPTLLAAADEVIE